MNVREILGAVVIIVGATGCYHYWQRNPTESLTKAVDRLGIAAFGLGTTGLVTLFCFNWKIVGWGCIASSLLLFAVFGSLILSAFLEDLKGSS